MLVLLAGYVAAVLPAPEGDIGTGLVGLIALPVSALLSLLEWTFENADSTTVLLVLIWLTLVRLVQEVIALRSVMKVTRSRQADDDHPDWQV